ncbi:MAG: DNA recombination protein RmuC [Haliea sp.]
MPEIPIPVIDPSWILPAAALVAGLALGAAAALVMRLRQLQQQNSEQAQRLTQLGNRHQALRSEYDRLLARQREHERQHKAQLQLLKENRAQLKLEFENLANRIFEARGKQFNDSSRATLNDLLQPFREQITGFQQRIDQVHSESLKGHALLEGELRKVLDVGLQMSSQASNLASALKGDNKTTGNWGEAQLERTLELAGLVAGEHYETQAAFRDEEGRRRLPDVLIKLPDNRHLVIDSKVSLVDYERAVAAESEEQRLALLEAHVRAVRQHLDDLAGKAYANLPGLGSPDFVLMFMPVEPAWIEAMRHNRELFNYGYQRGVVLVSHTTLMPVLRTVANLWIVERSNREAREISRSAGDLYNQVCTVAERLQRLGNTLQAAANHYNSTVISLSGKQGLAGKVDRFQQLSTATSKNMPALEPLHLDIDTDRLAFATEAAGEDPAASAEGSSG